MKRLTEFLAAAVALGFAVSAHAAGPQEQTAAQTSPSAQAQDVSAEQPTDPSAASGPTPPSEQPRDPSVSSSAASAAEQPTDPSMPSGSSDSAKPATPANGADMYLAGITPAGMSTREACAGFKSTLQCAATLHAAQNLSIPFVDLKSKVTGGQTLGAAIHDLKPTASVTGEVRRAEQQARADVRNAPKG